MGNQGDLKTKGVGAVDEPVRLFEHQIVPIGQQVAIFACQSAEAPGIARGKLDPGVRAGLDSVR